MTDNQPATDQINSLDIDKLLTSNTVKDYALGRGGKMFQIPKRNYIPKKSRDVRISARDAAIDFASQQVRHVRYCNDKKCSYQWCPVVKSLLDHWKVCKERKNNIKCYKCDSLRVLFLRSQGKFVAPPPRFNNNNRDNNNGGSGTRGTRTMSTTITTINTTTNVHT